MVSLYYYPELLFIFFSYFLAPSSDSTGLFWLKGLQSPDSSKSMSHFRATNVAAASAEESDEDSYKLAILDKVLVSTVRFAHYPRESRLFHVILL
jgi:hypothetical protein